jgi:hypothetical protein
MSGLPDECDDVRVADIIRKASGNENRTHDIRGA